MLPNLLDDLMRAWDHHAPSGEAPAPPPSSAPPAAPQAVPAEISQAAASTENASPSSAKFVAVSLAGRRFAFPVEAVVEAARCPRTTRVPGLPDHVRGVFNFRGEVLPVIDMNLLTAEPGGEVDPPALSTESRILTLQSPDGVTRAAFAFDALEGIVNLHREPARAQDLEHPGLGSALSAIGRHDGDRTGYSILDAARLLRMAGCFDDEPEAA